MSNPPIEKLRQVIRDQHGCDAVFVECVTVLEIVRDQTVWSGDVCVFDLVGHPHASRCYAWVDEGEGEHARCLAVLHAGPIDSPRAAVRARGGHRR